MKFIKAEGIGNDFVFIKKEEMTSEYLSKTSQSICNRHFGIGADGMILYLKNESGYLMEIYNADGTEASMCGNALRCLAAIHFQETGKKESFQVKIGEKFTTVSFDEDLYCVNLGKPTRIFSLPKKSSKIRFVLVDVGNVHAITIVDDVDAVDLEKLATPLQAMLSCNVGIISHVFNNEFKLRVYEQGVGETLACGSGASAAFYALRSLGYVYRSATARLKGGSLFLYETIEGEIILKGPANIIYKGEISLD